MIGAIELSKRLGLPHPPTDEQAAVIEAPLAPAVVIAGAGSGKTETMAARVVWLVANQRITPDAVLGLTFTRKAAAELGRRIRRRLAQWRLVLERDADGDAALTEQLAQLLAGEPTVLTYAAYAGRLVAEHAMRVGAEPDARLISPAVGWQLADQVSRNHPDTLPEDIGAPSSVPRYVLEMSGQLADHLVSVEQVETMCGELLDWFETLPLGKSIRSPYPGDTAKLIDSTAPPVGPAAARPGLRRGQGRVAGRRLRRPDDGRGRRWHGWPRSSRSSAPGSARSCSTSTRTPGTRRSRCCAACSVTVIR